MRRRKWGGAALVLLEAPKSIFQIPDVCFRGGAVWRAWKTKDVVMNVSNECVHGPQGSARPPATAVEGLGIELPVHHLLLPPPPIPPGVAAGGTGSSSTPSRVLFLLPSLSSSESVIPLEGGQGGASTARLGGGGPEGTASGVT